MKVCKTINFYLPLKSPHTILKNGLYHRVELQVDLLEMMMFFGFLTCPQR